jgi:hypothetical protein
MPGALKPLCFLSNQVWFVGSNGITGKRWGLTKDFPQACVAARDGRAPQNRLVLAPFRKRPDELTFSGKGIFPVARGKDFGILGPWNYFIAF